MKPKKKKQLVQHNAHSIKFHKLSHPNIFHQKKKITTNFNKNTQKRKLHACIHRERERERERESVYDTWVDGERRFRSLEWWKSLAGQIAVSDFIRSPEMSRQIQDDEGERLLLLLLLLLLGRLIWEDRVFFFSRENNVWKKFSRPALSRKPNAYERKVYLSSSVNVRGGLVNYKTAVSVSAT